MNLLHHYLYRMRRAWVRLCRFRHRRGYGIHSPFAFAKVTGVFYERGTYYAYADLAAAYPVQPCGPTRRDLRLLLRLCNDAMPRTALVWTAAEDPATLAYLRAGRPSCHFSATTEAPNLAAVAVQPDLLYVDAGEQWAESLEPWLEATTDRSVLILRGIHRNRSMLAAWRRLQARQNVRVTFDLYEWGLAYFERRLNKQDYLISY